MTERVSWKGLSAKERKRLVEEAARKIAANTGYRSKKEKAEEKSANGRLSNTDPREHKQHGNRPNRKSKKH